MNGRNDDERRYGESRPGGGRTFEGEHDVGRSRQAGQGVEGGGARGSYGARPYASRNDNYNYDPRGDRGYSYSGARGSMVSPEWDHYHGDAGGNYQGDFASPYERPASGRREPMPSSYPEQGGSRYAGADYGRGFQSPGRDRYDADDAESRQRMQHWSGARAQGQAEAYGPYRGANRLDEGRSGYRSSWGASNEQMARGQDYRGHGPQGYERSDERLSEDICERMTDDPDIDPREVRVQVSSGVVTLEGRVDDRWMKHHIEDLVDACSGVKSIENRIRVGQRGVEDSNATPRGRSASQH